MVVTLADYLQERVSGLERKQATQGANVEEHLSDHFRVAVSCPPDTRLHMRGGNVFEGSTWLGTGRGYYIESYTADLGDPDTIDNYTGNFDNAYYYIGVIFGREFYGFEHYIIGGTVEYATAAGAEAYIETVALRLAPWQPGLVVPVGQGGLPLCAVVLRNDGRTGIDGAIMPIDRVNRGRSYYWKDVRPRHYVHIPGGPD
jgi:hypothetical protein